MSEQPVEAVEIERKYEVAASAELPAAADFARIGLTAVDEGALALIARYFDTPDGALARRRLALRVRGGGKDDGWHLKEKGGSATRELLWPPAAEMPDGLRDEIRTRIGEAADRVAPLAELRTERRVLRLLDAEGREAVEIADDRVRALDATTGVRRAWREWEAELAPGADAALLDEVEPLLIAAGAAPSLSTAKIARATGRLAEAARAAGAGADRVAALERMDGSDRETARRLEP